MYLDKQIQCALSNEEIEVLQEIMNIAFGKSAADLTEVIDAQVVLNIPYINMVQIKELPVYIKMYVKDYGQISIVEQKFWGRFKGDAVLVFSSGSGKELIKMLQSEESSSCETVPFNMVERETLMEVGNIIIGACVGKLAELLNDVVTYTPPIVLVEKDYNEAISKSNYEQDATALVLKTNFAFDVGNVSGFLFLVTSNESVLWLKEALQNFIKLYE